MACSSNAHTLWEYKGGFNFPIFITFHTIKVLFRTCLNKLSGISFASVKPTLKDYHLVGKYMFRKIHSFFFNFFFSWCEEILTISGTECAIISLFSVFPSYSKTAFSFFLSLSLQIENRAFLVTSSLSRISCANNMITSSWVVQTLLCRIYNTLLESCGQPYQKQFFTNF